MNSDPAKAKDATPERDVDIGFTFGSGSGDAAAGPGTEASKPADAKDFGQTAGWFGSSRTPAEQVPMNFGRPDGPFGNRTDRVLESIMKQLHNLDKKLDNHIKGVTEGPFFGRCNATPSEASTVRVREDDEASNAVLSEEEAAGWDVRRPGPSSRTAVQSEFASGSGFGGLGFAAHGKGKGKGKAQHSPRGWSPPGSSRKRHDSSSKEDNAIAFLDPLGHFSELESESDVTKMVKFYAKKSINLHPKSDLHLIVHGVYKLGKFENPFKSGKVTKAKKEVGKGKGKGEKGMKEKAMLLWTKTNPKSVKSLASEDDGCMAFYDRLCRALPVPAKDIKPGFRQTILLCKVILGNKEKSPHGYNFWKRKRGPPRGCQSIKGVGKFRPNWERCLEHKGTFVPAGETEKDTEFPSYEIDYNEYIIYKADQVKVKFAVDIEIM